MLPFFLFAVSSLVRKSEPRFRSQRRFVQEIRHLPFGTGPRRPVRLHSGAIVAPRKFHGVSTSCKFAVAQNVVQNVDHSFVPYSDFRC